MEFAILFILSFLAGLAIYQRLKSWLPAVLIPLTIFILTTLADVAAKEAWLFTLLFGLPIVFFASLLGAYVVQIRSPDYLENESLSRETDESGERF